jgi:hypothetical protein
MAKTRLKESKEFWDARTTKKAKKIGLVIGAVGTTMGGGAAFGLPSWVGVTGFVFMVLGALVSNLFTDDPK